jgi:hypothetical protein
VRAMSRCGRIAMPSCRASLLVLAVMSAGGRYSAHGQTIETANRLAAEAQRLDAVAQRQNRVAQRQNRAAQRQNVKAQEQSAVAEEHIRLAQQLTANPAWSARASQLLDAARQQFTVAGQQVGGAQQQVGGTELQVGGAQAQVEVARWQLAAVTRQVTQLQQPPAQAPRPPIDVEQRAIDAAQLATRTQQESTDNQQEDTENLQQATDDLQEDTDTEQENHEAELQAMQRAAAPAHINIRLAAAISYQLGSTERWRITIPRGTTVKLTAAQQAVNLEDDLEAITDLVHPPASPLTVTLPLGQVVQSVAGAPANGVTIPKGTFVLLPSGASVTPTASGNSVTLSQAAVVVLAASKAIQLPPTPVAAAAGVTPPQRPSILIEIPGSEPTHARCRLCDAGVPAVYVLLPTALERCGRGYQGTLLTATPE